MKRIAQCLLVLVILVLVTGLILPKFNTDRYRARIQRSIENALERKVTFGELRFNLLTGPGFTLSDVIVGEDPAIGAEPIAYVKTLKAVPRFWSLWTGSLQFSSLRLEDDAYIDLSRTRTPAGGYRWNVERLLTPAIIAAFPNIQIRGGRIQFQADNVKSVVYLLDSDLDISPPSSKGDPWSFRFEGKPARTDRPARGSGSFSARGTWRPSRGLLDLVLELERSELGDMIALIRGEDVGLYGSLTGRAHLAGPPSALAVDGRIKVAELHGWDQSVPQGETWPLDITGKWNVPSQQLKLDARASNVAVHYLVEQYFTNPRWGVSLNFNNFSLEPAVSLARHFGAPLPAELRVAGKLDGVLGYSVQSGFEGQALVRDTTLSLPGSQPLKFESADVLVSQGRARLLPATVTSGDSQQATIEGSYAIGAAAPDFSISATAMDIRTLEKQAVLTDIPLLSAVQGGRWSGVLRFEESKWRGDVELTGVKVPFPGFSEPIRIDSTQAAIDGDRVNLRRIHAQIADVAAQGDYRYEPGALRPHRFHFTVAALDAQSLEKLARPTLSRRAGLFGLGKTTIPAWLKDLRADGTIQIDQLTAAGVELSDLRSRVLWDGAHMALPNLTARFGEGTVGSRVLIDLRGKRPVYEASTQAAGIVWKGGRLDADAILQTSGLEDELLTRLRSNGSFAGHSIVDDFPIITGRFEFSGAPNGPSFSLSDLRLSSGAEIYTGSGALQGDGTLLLQVSSGVRRLRLAGALTGDAALHLLQ